MKVSPFYVTRRSILLIILTVLISFIAGISFLVVPSYFSPVYILAGIIVVVLFFALLKKPIWAIYLAIFVALLPASLIPAQINSYLNRSSIVIALVVWVIDVINRRSRINITSSTLLLGLFIVWAAISLLWAEYFSEGVSILQRYILRLVLFLLLIVNEVRTKKNFNGLMNTLAVSGGLLVIVSLFTILKQGYSIGDRLQVLDVNENELGISLILTLPAVFWWSLRPTTKSLQTIKKIIAISYLLASIGLIGLSGSRGSALSLGIMLFMFLLWKPTQFLGIFSLLIIGVSFIITPIIFSTTISRFLEAAGEASLGGREYIWPVAWQLIKEHPILGIGIGNSPYQMIPFLAYAGIIKLGFLSVNEISIHNPILVIWAETGLPGLFLYLGVLVSAIISFFRQFLFSRKIHDDYLMPYFAIVSSMFIGYMAHWIKGGGLESDYSYFLVLALLLIPSQVQIGNSQNS